MKFKRESYIYVIITSVTLLYNSESIKVTYFLILTKLYFTNHRCYSERYQETKIHGPSK